MFDKFVEILTQKHTILYILTCFTVIVIFEDLTIWLMSLGLHEIFDLNTINNEAIHMYNALINNNKYLLEDWKFLFLANNTWIISVSLLVLAIFFYLIKLMTTKLIIFYDLTFITLGLLLILVDISILTNFVYRKININSELFSLNNTINMIILCLYFCMFTIINFQELDKKNTSIKILNIVIEDNKIKIGITIMKKFKEICITIDGTTAINDNTNRNDNNIIK